MKILHVSNFAVRRNGAHFWNIPHKLTNGFIRGGHHVFSFSDRDIADGFFLGVRQLGVAHVNAKLIEVCREIRPDLLLLGHCSLIAEKTVAAVREMVAGMRVAHWNCDPLFFPKNLARLCALAPLADATFATTAGEQLSWIAGGRSFFMPNPVDKSIETLRMFETVPENDLVFITSRDPEKERIAGLIASHIPDLKFDVRGLFGRAQVHGAAMFDTLACAKMGLNVSRRNDVHLYSSDRMSLLMGNGLLTFIDRRTGFDTIFTEDEMAFYDSDEDMLEKIRALRRDDARRRAMAERGWKHIHDIFDGTRVARYIAQATFGETFSEQYPWPLS